MFSKVKNLQNCPIMSGQWQLSKQLNPNCEESSCLESNLSLENAIRKAKMNVRVGSHKNIVQKTHAVVTAQLEFHRFLMNKRISEWYRINLSSVSHASPLTDSKWWQFWSGRSLDALSAALFFGHDIISPWFATRCSCSASAFRTMSAGSSYSAHAPSIAAIACLGVDMFWPVASGRWRFPETTKGCLNIPSQSCVVWVTLRFNSMVNRNKHQQPVVSEYGGDHLRSIFHTYHGTWFVSRPTNLNKSWWFIWQSHLTSKILKAAKCVGHNPNYEPTNGISPSTSREFEGIPTRGDWFKQALNQIYNSEKWGR